MFVDYNQHARDHTIASAYSVWGSRWYVDAGEPVQPLLREFVR